MNRWNTAIYRLLCVIGWSLVAVSLAGFGGRLWWIFDLFSHFRVQYGIGLIMTASVLAFRHRWKNSLIFSIFAVLNLALVVPVFFGNTIAPAGAVKVKAVVINVEGENSRFELVDRFVRESKADIILFEEVNRKWFTRLKLYKSMFPYVAHSLREDNFGIALFSRYPLVRSEIVPLGIARFPSIFVDVEIGGRVLRVLGTHAPPPVCQKFFIMRNYHFSQLPLVLAKQLELDANSAGTNKSTVLMGDLNASPWCHYYRRLTRETGLYNSSRGHGIFPTWHARKPPFMIPIDHVLLSPDLVCTKKRIGPYIGSDHLPVLVDIAIP